MTRLEAMRFGVLASLPMIIGNMPFGIIFGSLVVSQGFPPWVAVAMSMLVFAGSAQFVAIGLLAAGAPAWVVLSTTLIVNLRHLLYSADFIKYVRHLPMNWRVLMGFGLIDETYAAIKPHYDSGQLDAQSGHWAYLGSFLAFYIMWNSTTLLGVLAGELIPGMKEWGMEFAMVATFLGIITHYLRTLPYWTSFISAATFALLLHPLPNNLGMLIAALLSVACGVLTEHLQQSFKPSGKNL
ncbi:MAG: branched-chain amino acid ABC transporter permease [Proteobacteria bacterium]|nr:MAG: branched-chain amino acid ABC transporter permease [Pseudomonadota bacterium]